MSPDKRARKPRAKKPVESVEVRVPALGRGLSYVVRWHPLAESERDASWPAGERVAIVHAAEKLEAEGMRLGHPHSSAIQGEEGRGLRELRPRGGRSRWRPIYRQVTPDTFVILAVGPEAQIDRAGFDAAVARAQLRHAQIDIG